MLCTCIIYAQVNLYNTTRLYTDGYGQLLTYRDRVFCANPSLVEPIFNAIACVEFVRAQLFDCQQTSVRKLTLQ